MAKWHSIALMESRGAAAVAVRSDQLWSGYLTLLCLTIPLAPVVPLYRQQQEREITSPVAAADGSLEVSVRSSGEREDCRKESTPLLEITL